jgi:hypothetical protein
MDSEGLYHHKKPRHAQEKCAQCDLLKQFSDTPINASA